MAAAAARKLDEIDESGVDRSYYHGMIDRDVAVARLQERNLDGAFLLRQSSSQAGVYTISLQSNGEIKHIRVSSTADGKFTLGKSKSEFDTIWDLVEAQLDQKLKSTSGNHEVQLIYPLESNAAVIAPDLLERAQEAGMGDLPQEVIDFMTGGVDVAELAARRKAAAE
mmetsp:Transcript_25215/g.65829  ORF Transcript_25215/g.65829 Transcript_25215/m.65829 type:complete len:168 (+) Transcript_25215:68-571(+)|eukprot:CAMPEP_0182925630 /NCGR_PEP_ID=MMETSP0105_2-20130417/9776_1 /TAXON_ID=81532 ORGANISM="Acanthoeca-like sp., Strain 10tr" /NCGR_SAMPLE_ID=MMETSP0105_2 /ASSEMBLY_ACC=CAM_ASM_000205 /LENGTH=167 /DNA_ID=CAMNT_0025063489 /DNA_START=62 /DNA_END=565 /DNA_ORIENTATION=+